MPCLQAVVHVSDLATPAVSQITFHLTCGIGDFGQFFAASDHTTAYKRGIRGPLLTLLQLLLPVVCFGPYTNVSLKLCSAIPFYSI